MEHRIIGFERYAINSGGYVINTHTGRRLRPDIVSKGYEIVTLSNNRVKERFYIHRLLAIYFIPNPEDKPQVNHINGVMLDNRIENLEWVTRKENIQHAHRTGLVDYNKWYLHGAKLTKEQVEYIRSQYKLKSNRELAAELNISATNISLIGRGKTWKRFQTETKSPAVEEQGIKSQSQSTKICN